jgi:AmmeMemoRadiSam system protein A
MVHEVIVFAGLMPHAPILVPGVGGERLGEASATARAMTTVASHALSARPDTLVLISPHSPRQPGAFGLWRTRRLRGSLDRFGSPDDEVDLPLDRTFAERFETEVIRSGLRTWEIPHGPLDHGAIVPLCYLHTAGWSGSTVIVSLNYPGDGGIETLGRAIAVTAKALSRRIAIIASGDMSHRLTPSAPAGYDPEARHFDESFIELLRSGAYRDIGRLDPEQQERAAEDVVDSTWVALAACDYRTDGHEVLSYEGPFGVGYGVAILFEPRDRSTVAPADLDQGKRTLSKFDDLPAVARRALEAEFAGGPGAPPFQAGGELAEPHGVFVTVRTDTGELRGCRGTLEAKEADLIHETWHNAVAGALHDYRFPPMEAADLPRMKFSVTVLGALEPAASEADLDPAVYGVVVTAADGRKGVLLPGIGGIDSVEQQLAITRHKAGIAPDEWITMQRFRARCFKEPGFVEERG